MSRSRIRWSEVGRAVEPPRSGEAEGEDDVEQLPTGRIGRAAGSVVGALPREDGDIEAALGAGDHRRALTLLMDRYGEPVRRYGYVMTRDPDLAEEIRQQVFVEAYRDLPRFAGRSSVRSWLFAIARNRSLDTVKKQRRWIARFKNKAPLAMERDERELDRELDDGRLAALLASCLDELAPPAREAVVLRFHLGLSYEEASRITGDRADTLQRRVARALPLLRRCFEVRLADR